MNAVEVVDQDQFLEILCTHAIVDHNNGKLSTPRFTVFVIEPEAQRRPAGIEAASGENMNLSMSPIHIKRDFSRDKDARIADAFSAAANRQVDLSEAVQPESADSKNAEKPIEEEKSDDVKEDDGKAKASKILASVFGEGAEDAVSIEGGVSDGDQYSQEEDLAASVSIVEEAYMVSDAFESRHEAPSKIISEPES